MLATLVVAAIAAAGPVRVTVEVVEYISQKPLVGAKVTLIEDTPDASNPREFTATTAARGKARFEVPHLNFKFKATFKGYLPARSWPPTAAMSSSSTWTSARSTPTTSSTSTSGSSPRSGWTRT
jgi:hypothetical protein